MRDEHADPHDDQEIMRHRRESWVDGYRQALADVQAWCQALPSIPAVLLVEKVRENAERYAEMMEVAPQIDEAIAEAHAGKTIDRGDFSQFLDDSDRDEEPSHSYLSTSCLHGEMVLPDGRTGHEYCKSEANPTGPKIPAVCKFCQAPCTCSCHEEQP